MTERDVAQGEMETKLQDWGAKLDEMNLSDAFEEAAAKVK